MCELSWLESAHETRGYILGPTIKQLTQNDHYRQDIINIAQPIIEELSYQINESITLVINKNGKRHQLMNLEPNRDILLKPTDNIDYNLYSHTTGLTILAFMNIEHRERYYKKFELPLKTSLLTTRSPEDFKKKCESIQKRGFLKTEYTTSSQDKITVVAFPVWIGINCTLAIGIQIPSFRFNNQKKEEIIKLTKNASKKITACLNN